LARPRIPFQSPSTSSSPFLSFYSLFKALRLSAITMGKAEVNHHHPHLCNQKRERERERDERKLIVLKSNLIFHVEKWLHHCSSKP